MANNQQCSVHTVGIGDGCDEQMLDAAARAGRGTCSLIADSDHESVLNSKVIHALENSMEPALEGC